MYKRLLVAVTVLGFSQAALADRADVWDCIDKSTLAANENCVASTFEKNSQQNDFFAQLAEKKVVPEQDAFATITYFPEQNLIVVKSLEARKDALLAFNH